MPSTPEGKTSFPKWTGSDSPKIPEYLEDLGQHFDDLIAETEPTASSLPATGNWLNRFIMAEDTKVFYRWSGTAWVADGGFPETGVFTINSTFKTSTIFEPLVLTRRGKRCRLRGVATLATGFSFSTGTDYGLGTIPAGFRPATTAAPMQAGAINPTNVASVRVLNSGAVNFQVLNAQAGFLTDTWWIGIDIEWDIP